MRAARRRRRVWRDTPAAQQASRGRPGPGGCANHSARVNAPGGCFHAFRHVRRIRHKTAGKRHGTSTRAGAHHAPLGRLLAFGPSPWAFLYRYSMRYATASGLRPVSFMATMRSCSSVQ